MEEYQVVKISPLNKKQQDQVSELLAKERIRRDSNLDYTCGIFDEHAQLIATGSCFKNTLRCIAVDDAYHGQGFMNKLVTHLINEQYARGYYHIFLYTKASCRDQFRDLGFYEIAYIENQIVFMENKRAGFQQFLTSLEQAKPIASTDKIAGIVMNCNPFTLGHQYLIEKAASENDWVHLFVVQEDASVFPFRVRAQLVRQGVSHLANVIVHTTGPYLISSATFPSYFQKDEDAVVTSQIGIDTQIFLKIAQHLKLTRRYVGTEPYSHVTHLYNEGMKNSLIAAGIDLIEVPRKENGPEAISASYVRQYLKVGDFERVKDLVPETTYRFLLSAEAEPILKALAATENVIHH